MSLDRFTIRTRLFLGFGIVVALLIAVALTSLVQLASFNRNVEAIANVRMVQLITVSHISNALGQITRNTGNVLVLDDEKQVKQELVSVRRNGASVKDLLGKLDKTVAAGRERELFDDILKARDSYVPHEEEFLKHADRGDYGTAKDELLKATRPAQLKLIEALDQFEQYEGTLSAEDARSAGAAYATTRTSLVGLTVFALALALASALMIIRSLRRELGGEPAYAKEVSTRIAQGDLTFDVKVQSGDANSMLFAMKQMSDNLRTLVGEVAGGARGVSDMSEQIARGNIDLSQRTEQQASTLEETASSMEQLTTTVTQNAQNAKQASELANGASEVARKGGIVVGQVVSTMTGISESSRKISDIISVIDSIAFQTNILALNAAVEAARAGEQGRGFAVVAAEVRNLAQRSAAAAKEIKTLIGDSVDKVDAGTKLVDNAGRTMGEIVTSVKKVSDLIAEIAAASQEQTSGIGQVNTAVMQMDQVVQQNASLVEEATAATESMKEQAGSLLQMVSRFKLGGEAVGQRENLQPITPRAWSAPVSAPMPFRVRNKATNSPAAMPTAILAATHGAPQLNGAAPNGAWKEF